TIDRKTGPIIWRVEPTRGIVPKFELSLTQSCCGRHTFSAPQLVKSCHQPRCRDRVNAPLARDNKRYASRKHCSRHTRHSFAPRLAFSSAPACCEHDKPR